MILLIISILGGILAASSAIIAKKPNAKELIDKITPYQGWIGVVLAIYGAWNIISCVLNMGMMGDFLLTWIMWLATSVVMFVVGFLLGYGLISKYALEKNEAAKEKGQQLRLKLIKYQVPAGILLIIFAVLYIVL